MLYEEELNENIEAVSDVWKLLLEMYQRLPFRVFFWKRIIRVIDIRKKSWRITWTHRKKEENIRLSGMPFCNGLPKLTKMM